MAIERSYRSIFQYLLLVQSASAKSVISASFQCSNLANNVCYSLKMAIYLLCLVYIYILQYFINLVAFNFCKINML